VVLEEQVKLRYLAIACTICAVGVASCAPAGAPAGGSTAADQQPAGKRKIVAGLPGDPAIFSNMIARAGAGNAGGAGEIERLMNVGLTVVDDRGELRPVIAESVPTTENGGWQVFPDGRMVTTWKLKSGVTWHDGAPFTTADLVYTAKVIQDPELPEFRDRALANIDSVEAPDANTIVVTWRRPFIEANTMFSGNRGGAPHPKHLVEPIYLENKDAYRSMPHWVDAYIGTGAFKLKEFIRGDHITLVANDAFVLGRPKVDEIEIRIVPNAQALAANVMGNLVDMTLTDMTLDTVVQILDTGWSGKAVGELDDPVGAWPQFMDPSPAVILEAPFRRALVHAMDREIMVQNLQYGMSQVAHTAMWPQDPLFKYVEPRIVKYQYDQRRAIELISGLGYTQGPDRMFRDQAGQPLRVELRATPGREQYQKAALVVADMWQTVGVGVDVNMIPLALNNDSEYRQTRTGFEISGMKYDLARFTTKEIPTAANRYIGDNRMRYASPQIDDWADRFYVTIPEAERGEIAAQAHHLLTDQVIMLNFVYDVRQGVQSSRLLNVLRPYGWNAHEWDVAPR
jgi:peptide/nickel transport system substrate-binding protein